MPLPADPSPALSAYAHPERLVTSDWLAGNLGRPGLAIVESDEDVLLYDVGHILITAAGHQVTAEGVFTYKVDSAGKMLALRAFWEVDQATASARKI